ncbi:S41 family peptidase, partial [Xanthovirga aplysinae]|uniref:S41 family peptidase n=1 Tax=Xanthovirga aplysinae TaxID=2529853 RepID=UPI001FE973F9
KLFSEILCKFKDGHINLDVPASLRSSVKKIKKPENAKTSTTVKRELIENYLVQSKSYNNGVIKWGKIKNSEIGYILISDMEGFANYVSSEKSRGKIFDQEYEKKSQSKSPLEYFHDELLGVEYVMNLILEDLENSPSIILDLRFNGGGYDTVALKILSFFIDQPKHILSIKARKGNSFTQEQKYIIEPSPRVFKGQVHLLTSSITASAAEVFTLGALSFPNIKRYGRSTKGIFSEVLWKNLPNGWEFSLSNEVFSDPAGNQYEIRGIPVDFDFNYPEDRFEFYNTFYHNNDFKDKTIEKILTL